MADCPKCSESAERVSALETALKQEETAADRTIWNLTQENIRLRDVLRGACSDFECITRVLDKLPIQAGLPVTANNLAVEAQARIWPHLEEQESAHE